jgi:hypothetical protein
LEGLKIVPVPVLMAISVVSYRQQGREKEENYPVSKPNERLSGGERECH